MAVTTFIPELWSARLLNALDNAHVAVNLVNRDYEGEIKKKGDTVHINTIGAVTVKDFTRNTDIAAPDALSTTDQTLTISQSKYFNFQLDDADAAQAAGDIMDKAMQRSAYALNDAADKYLLGVLADGADPANVVGATAAVALTKENIYENIVKLRTLLDKQNVPTAGRTLVIPPEAYALILQDERFTGNGGAKAEEAARNGFVGKIAGFEIYESNNCKSTTASSTTTYVITAQVRTACTYAEQIVNVEAYRPEKRFADAVKGLHLYGAKVTDGKQIAALKCTF